MNLYILRHILAAIIVVPIAVLLYPFAVIIALITNSDYAPEKFCEGIFSLFFSIAGED